MTLPIDIYNEQTFYILYIVLCRCRAVSSSRSSSPSKAPTRKSSNLERQNQSINQSINQPIYSSSSSRSHPLPPSSSPRPPEALFALCHYLVHPHGGVLCYPIYINRNPRLSFRTPLRNIARTCHRLRPLRSGSHIVTV